ncbi:MAG: hypothetical protein WCJ58_04905 [bacterium]
MKNLKILLTTLLLFGIFPALSILVSAAGTVNVNGTAEIVSTGGTFLFDTNNSDVTVDSATGDMSGFVWSEELGWVDFDNNGGANPAKVNLTTGRISGLASTSNTDGVLDFSNYNSNATVNLTTGGISGYAWSEDLGWVDFSSARVAGSLLSLIQTGQNALPVVLGAIPLIGLSVFLTKRSKKN